MAPTKATRPSGKKQANVAAAAPAEPPLFFEDRAGGLPATPPAAAAEPATAAARKRKHEEDAPVASPDQTAEEEEGERQAKTQASGEARKRKRAPPQKQLDPEMRSYFENVENLLADVSANFAEEEDKHIFVNNVYKEMDGQEGNLCTDPDCSRILERLLSVSTAGQARILLNKMQGDVLFVMTHRNGSHVLQSLLSYVPEWLQTPSAVGASEADNVGEDVPSIEQLLVNVCAEISPRALDLTYDAYGSHVFRVLLNVLSGRPVETLTRSKNSKKYREGAQLTKTPEVFSANQQNKSPLPSFAKALNDLTAAMLGSLSGAELRNALREMATNPTSSPVLQLLLVVHSGNKEILTSLLNSLLLESADSTITPVKRYDSPFTEHGIKDSVCSHVFEVIFQVAPPEIYLGLYVAHFRGKLADLCQHNVANFVVAQLISASKSSVHIDMLLDELMPSLSFLLFNNRAGIVHRMTEVCARTPGVRQKRLMQSIARAFNGHLTQHRKILLNLILQLKVAPETGDFTGDINALTPLGAQIASALFQFAATEQVPLVLSLMTATPETLVGWCKTLGGSKMIESFLDSKSGPELKLKLIKKFAGHLATIACDKYGSHTVDCCWKHSSMEQKEKIADELAAKESMLSSDHFGRFILRNCQVQQFKRRKSDWREKEESKNRKKALFADILDDDATGFSSSSSASSGSDPATQKKMQDTIKAMEREYDEHLAILGFGTSVPTGAAKRK